MKTIKLMALVLCLFGLQAQMSGSSYLIVNGQNCDITVLYEVSDCSIVCNDPALILSPGASFNVPCAGPGRDIYIWLKEMDYVNVTPGGASTYAVGLGGCFGPWPQSTTGPVPAAAAATFLANGGACSSPTGNYTLNASPTMCIIGY